MGSMQGPGEAQVETKQKPQQRRITAIGLTCASALKLCGRSSRAPLKSSPKDGKEGHCTPVKRSVGSSSGNEQEPRVPRVQSEAKVRMMTATRSCASNDFKIYRPIFLILLLLLPRGQAISAKPIIRTILTCLTGSSPVASLRTETQAFLSPFPL